MGLMGLINNPDHYCDLVEPVIFRLTLGEVIEVSITTSDIEVQFSITRW